VYSVEPAPEKTYKNNEASEKETLKALGLTSKKKTKKKTTKKKVTKKKK